LPKLGKDVLDKKSKGTIRTKKEREIYEEAKRRRVEEEEEEEKQKKVIKSKLPEDKEPTPEELEKQKAEVTAGMRRLKVKKVVLKKEEE